MNKHLFHLALIALIGLALIGCSSLPRGSGEVFERQNEAAGYLRLGDTFLSRNQYDSATQFYNEALQTNLSVDHVPGAIKARSSLGKVYLRMGELGPAQRELQDALFDARVFGEPNLLALTLNNMGELFYLQQSQTLAKDFFTEAISLVHRDDALLAIIHHNLGVIALDQGNLVEARTLLQTASQSNQRSRIWSEFASNAYMLAVLENRSGNLPEAIRWAEQALEADKRAENSQGIGADLEALGNLHRRSGNFLTSFDYYRRAFHLGVASNNEPLVRTALAQLIELAELINQPAFGVRYRELLGLLD
jgi:tetratricopeptide (TPR) repeat protein